MKTDEIPTDGPSDWQPITNKHDLAVLGKLGEEASELSTACHRCTIQGMDEQEPTTGKPNRQWLEEEIADVLAMAEIAMDRFGLNPEVINDRRMRKVAYKQPWFDALERLDGL